VNTNRFAIAAPTVIDSEVTLVRLLAVKRIVIPLATLCDKSVKLHSPPITVKLVVP
jgi:hypothetical protein